MRMVNLRYIRPPQAENASEEGEGEETRQNLTVYKVHIINYVYVIHKYFFGG